MALGSETDLEGGAGSSAPGLAIYLVNWLFRIGARASASAKPRTPRASTSTATAAGPD